MNYLVLNRIQLYGFASFKKLSFQISDNTVYIHIYLSTYASVLYISIYICLLLTFLIVMKTGEEKREPFFFFFFFRFASTATEKMAGKTYSSLSRNL